MRVVLATLVLLLFSTHAHGETPWYERCLVGMEVGPTGAQWGSDPRDIGYAASFSGADIVAKQMEVGSEYLVLWGRDHEWAYYDSTLMPKCPGLGDRDPLREAVEAAKPHHLPVIVYTVVQASGYALREHPEFAMVGLDGNAIPNRVCLNGPYRDFVKGLLKEMLAYGIQGFHVDMVDQGFGPPYGCACDTCKALFKTQFGGDMPGGVTWDARWDQMLTFRYDTSANFERDIRDFVKAGDPAVSVDFNYHGYPPFSFQVGQRPVQHAHIGDFVTCESGPWGFGALSSGLTAEFVRASGPGRPYQVVMQRGTRFYHDQTCRPLNDLRWEMFSLLARGAQVTTVDKTPYSGVMDPVAYRRIGQVFEEVLRKQAHFGQAPVYEAGLYYSGRARDWYGREDPPRYEQSLFGAHQALTYAHVPAGVVLDENISLEALREFPVVILPNVTIVSENEAALLETYVAGGGALVITGQSGCYDRYGVPMEHSTLEKLAGARLKSMPPDQDNYLRLDAAPQGIESLAEDFPLGWPNLIYGPAAVYEPHTATAYGQLVAPIRRTRQREGKKGTSFPSSAGEAVGPGILVNRIGAGTVLTLAVAPDVSAGGEYRTAEASHLLSNAVRALHPAPRIAIDAPQYVETAVTDDPASKTLRVHFIAYPAPPGITNPKRPWVLPALIEDTPLYRARVTIRGTIGEVSALNPSTELRAEGGTVSLMIEDIHEVLVLRYD